MQEVLEQILLYIRSIWRYRWYALTLTWSICVIGWIVVIKMPDQFRSEAKVYVDTVSILQPLLSDVTYGINQRDEVRLIQQNILTDPSLEKVVRATDMDLKARNDVELRGMVEKVKSRIVFQKDLRDEIYNIAYSDTDPELAAKVVQAILDIFREKALRENRKDSTAASAFLDSQIAEYEKRLKADERKLAEFKQKNIGRMPEQGKDFYVRLQEAQRQTKEAELELRQVEKQAQELKRQIAGEEPTFGIVPKNQSGGVNFSEIDQRIATLQVELDQLLLRYTENHPDVASIKSLISELRQEKQAQLEEYLKQASQSGIQRYTQDVETNPVYQQLKIAYGEAESRVASMRVKVEAFRKRGKRTF